jgi:hypothetical protein
MIYRWEIKTSDVRLAGTDANVFLGLRGSVGAMREMELRDPNAHNNWEQGDVNHGQIQTSDLGNLQTGTLRHDGWGGGPDWSVDYVRVTNDEDGRVWIAHVGSELKGNQVFRLVFTLEDPGQYEQMKKQKALEAQRKKIEEEKGQSQVDSERAEKELEEEEKKAQEELLRQQKQLEIEKRRAKLALDVARSRAEVERMRTEAGLPPSGGVGPVGGAAPSSLPPGFRTLELFGQLGGRTVPLLQVLANQGGRFAVVQGGAVLGGESAAEGFGYGGSPGRWSEVSGGASPANFGQDPGLGIVGFDGSRAYPVPASTLEQLFGGNWRAVLI